MPRAAASRNARRRFLLATFALAPGWRFAFAAEPYPQTIAALKNAFQRETDAHRRYAAFAQTASKEGYRGIAYLFTAFSTSEGVHARNFRDLLTRLGEKPEPAPTTINTGTTKQNLIAAVDDEIDSIERMYPQARDRVRPEGNEEAARLVAFAYASEHQHRDLLQKIRRFSPMLFEQVAKVIDQKTGLYFVCQACGSTLNKKPALKCVVCGGPADGYLQVPIPD